MQVVISSPKFRLLVRNLKVIFFSFLYRAMVQMVKFPSVGHFPLNTHPLSVIYLEVPI